MADILFRRGRKATPGMTPEESYDEFRTRWQGASVRELVFWLRQVHGHTWESLSPAFLARSERDARHFERLIAEKEAREGSFESRC